MILKYKILLKQQKPEGIAAVGKRLIDLNGYIVNKLSADLNDGLVNENDVRDYLNTGLEFRETIQQTIENGPSIAPRLITEQSIRPDNEFLVERIPTGNVVREDFFRSQLPDETEKNPNTNIVESFITFLRRNTTATEFNNIYYDSNKVYLVLNDFYDKKIKQNIDPDKTVIKEVLSGTSILYYQNNTYDLETGNKKLENKSVLIGSGEEEDSFYVPIKIVESNTTVKSTDFSSYVEDCIKDGVVLKNCFVDLNKKDDPFEGWSYPFRTTNQILREEIAIARDDIGPAIFGEFIDEP